GSRRQALDGAIVGQPRDPADPAAPQTLGPAVAAAVAEAAWPPKREDDPDAIARLPRRAHVPDGQAHPLSGTRPPVAARDRLEERVDGRDRPPREAGTRANGFDHGFDLDGGRKRGLGELGRAPREESRAERQPRERGHACDDRTASERAM